MKPSPGIGKTGTPMCTSCPNTFLVFVMTKDCYQCPSCHTEFEKVKA